MKKRLLLCVALLFLMTYFSGCVFKEWEELKDNFEQTKKEMEDASVVSVVQQQPSESEELLPLLTLEEYISDVVDETSSYEDSSGYVNNYSYKIPSLTNIDTYGAREINSEINNRFATAYDEMQECKSSGTSVMISCVDYRAYLTGDVLSLCVWEQYEWEQKVHFAYNINVRTGERISNQKLVEMCGLSEDEFIDKLKDINIRCFEDMYKGTVTDEKLYQRQYEYNISSELLNIDIPLYIGEDGSLYAVSDIASFAGASSYQYILDTEIDLK